MNRKSEAGSRNKRGISVLNGDREACLRGQAGDVRDHRLVAVSESRDQHVELVFSGSDDTGKLHARKDAADSDMQLGRVRQRCGAVEDLT